MLSGCASSSNKVASVAISQPDVPKDIRVCFDKSFKLPPGTTYNKKQVFAIIAGMRRLDVEKTSCGKRLISWYEKNKG